MDLIDAIAKAIATMEGFYKAGTVAARNNNPGNLRSWPGAGSSGGFAVFSTAEAGWDALRQQIRKNIGRGLTLEEFFGGKSGVYPGYAPAADSNQPDAYARFVAGRAGIPADQPIAGFTSGSSPAAVSFFPSGPSWSPLPESGWASGETLAYAAAGMIALAAAWALLAD